MVLCRKPLDAFASTGLTFGVSSLRVVIIPTRRYASHRRKGIIVCPVLLQGSDVLRHFLTQSDLLLSLD